MGNNAIAIAHLTDVPETVLYPLKARYVETKKANGIIKDPLSVKILDALEYDPEASKLVVMSQLGVCLRTVILDEQVGAFLSKNPDAVVVNIACGLDTRFPRVDNGRVQWFDLDVPEVIAIRRHFFSETDRHRFIAQSALDSSWADKIPKGKKTLFIIEGLSFYFTEEENRKMLGIIADHFPGAECLMEILASWYIKMITMSAGKKTYKDPLDNKVALLLKWGVNCGSELNGWMKGMRFAGQWFVTQKRMEAFPLLFRCFCAVIPALSRVNKIVRLVFE